MHLHFLYVFPWLDSSFLSSAIQLNITQYSAVWAYHSLLIRSPAEGHLDCSQVVAVMNKAVINIHVQVLVWTSFSNPLGKREGA